jgi:hypothetical protein
MGIPKNHFLDFLVIPLQGYTTYLEQPTPDLLPGRSIAQAVSIPRLPTGTNLIVHSDSIGTPVMFTDSVEMATTIRLVHPCIPFSLDMLSYLDYSKN